MINLNAIKETFNKWALNGRSEQMAAGHAYSVAHMLQSITILYERY